MVEYNDVRTFNLKNQKSQNNPQLLNRKTVCRNQTSRNMSNKGYRDGHKIRHGSMK